MRKLVVINSLKCCHFNFSVDYLFSDYSLVMNYIVFVMC